MATMVLGAARVEIPELCFAAVALRRIDGACESRIGAPQRVARNKRSALRPRFYVPDKNGEVRAGELHGAGFLRRNPRTDQWIEDGMSEPYAHDRRTWIDNSTDPISGWYLDYQGYIVRIQPLD